MHAPVCRRATQTRGVASLETVPNFVPSGGLWTFVPIATSQLESRVDTGESHSVQTALNL